MRQFAVSSAMLAACWLVTAQAHAHKPSDSYVVLERTDSGVRGTWDVALRDLDHALELDDGDGALTAGELRRRAPEIVAFLRAGLTLSAGAQTCALDFGPPSVVEHSDGAYARHPLQVACAGAVAPDTLHYRLLFALDPQHRAIVRVVARDDDEQTLVLGRGHGPQPLALAGLGAPPALGGLFAFVVQGVEHILAGLDHILFLLVLLLPAVLQRRDRAWVPVHEIRSVLRDVTKIVTAFTVAHSITLALAALGAVQVSARVIEPAIAASVALAALNNLVPLFGTDRWAVAFALGLLHGFGFSSALADVGLAGAQLAPALFGFNLGVELGQLAIVALFVPLAFLARALAGYRRFALGFGSLAIFAVSLVWLIQRIEMG